MKNEKLEVGCQNHDPRSRSSLMFSTVSSDNTVPQ